MERRPDRFTVVLDTNVLFGALARNLLLTLGEVGFYRPRWSPEILEELERNLLKNERRPEYVKLLLSEMQRAFPEACVSDSARYINAFDPLPDPDDAHVLAAAIKCDAPLIVTDNIKDFPSEILLPLGIECMTADEFIADLIDLDQETAVTSIESMRVAFKRPEIDQAELVQRLWDRGLPQSATILKSAYKIG